MRIARGVLGSEADQAEELGDALAPAAGVQPVQVESLREEGLTGEGAAETLFVLGCYLGEVMARALGGKWVPTARSPLAGLSPWPMVVMLRDGTAWDAIGKAYKRLELGDSEYLPAFYAAAAATIAQR